MNEDDTTVTKLKNLPAEHAADQFLVVIYADKSAALGSRHVLGSGPVRVGRMSDNDIVLDDDAVSRRHARLEKRADGWAVMDVGSRNGTLVNEREVSGVMMLRPGDHLQIGRTIFKLLGGNRAEAEFFEEIYRLRITDNLTKVVNRRRFDEVLEGEVLRARRHERPLSLLMFDIDWFKRVNDDHGHLMGDTVLREVAQFAQTRVRRDDTIARYGGEEFVVLMPETALKNAQLVAEQLRAGIAGHAMEYRGVRLSVSVSVGCAELRESDFAPTDLVRRADEKLYEAKNAGRNCVR
jgi:diguanylate cyclase (GGDEF)-like protein